MTQGESAYYFSYSVEEVNGRALTTRNIIVSTGARPFIPPIKGLNDLPISCQAIW